MKRSCKLKKPDSVPNLILEEIIGLTTKNANGLASSISTSKCAYIAGCVVVLYDVDSSTQSHLMVFNRMPKPLTCVALSRDARVVAAGESGPRPAVLVWDGITSSLIRELKGHQYGVACIAISPDGKCLASIGFPRDGYICLWDWRSKILMTKIKASSQYPAFASVSFSLDTKFIVTAGKKHLRFWKVGSPPNSRASTRSTSVAMQGKPINLGHCEGFSFVAVTAPSWTKKSSVNHIHAAESPIYALTDTGILCVLVGSSIITSVELEVEKGFALSTSNSLVACACNNGLVKLFGTSSLQYAGSLCYTEAKRCNKLNVVDCNTDNSQVGLQSLPELPDAIACQFSTLEKLVVIYDDHSLYIWDVRDVQKATRCFVLVSHGASIWDVKNLPCENMHNPSLSCVAKGCSGGLSFATCSADGTIRVWDLALQSTSSMDKFSLYTVDSSLINHPSGTTCLVSAGIFERDFVTLGISSPGLRSMAVSSDGKHLAAGDCQGNLHILNVNTSDYICIQDAHDGEILSLSFNFENQKDNVSTEVSESHQFLASGGRDGMIHVYRVDSNFDLIGKIDCHSTAATPVNLTCSGTKIISCGGDRSLVVHNVIASEKDCKISCCCRIATSGTIQDMVVNNSMEVAITVGKDKKINTFSINTGKLVNSIDQDGDTGDPVKVTIDGSCSYLVCSYSNRCICMFDYITGELVARAVGHSDVITGIAFLPDCKHLVSIDADSCIFVWKVPAPFSSQMLQRTKGISFPISPKCMVQQVSLNKIGSYQFDDHSRKDVAREKLNQNQGLLFQHGSYPKTSAFRFSISRLPKWARAKVSIPNPIPTDPNSSSSKIRPGKCSPLLTHGLQEDSASPIISQSTPRHGLEGSNKFSGTLSSILSDTDCSQGSPSPQETCSYALDNRWLKIHTVCMDLLNSPDISDVEALNVPHCALESMCEIKQSQDLAMETYRDNKRIKLSSIDTGLDNPAAKPIFDFREDTLLQDSTLKECVNYSGTLCDSMDQHQIRNLNLCHEHVFHEMSAKLQSNKTEAGVREVDKDYNISNTNSQIEGRKSSARKSYSARLLLQRNRVGGLNRFSGMQARDSVGAIQRESAEAEPNSMLKDPSNPLLKILQRTDADGQDAGNSPVTLLGPIRAIPRTDSGEVLSSTKGVDTPLSKKLIDGGDHEGGNIDGLENLETAISCKEALHNLDSAAQSALQLFSKFANLDPEGRLRGSEVQLYAEAAERLPSIAKKVHAIAKLVQYAKILSNENKWVDEGSACEPSS
ncbi:mitogen-activated kinase-binding 1 [Olea europaea subsp. europaea]|uniref:Mitogen-activated kinase-binding 1 n=1 Tax=Olea europaea subsp. europaea TaxID=158383 RepID=A0A8S0VDW8_OLEEU|nr:mitogen-activated kinase-binding 1 [Olea europaea subsp. europaea]